MSPADFWRLAVPEAAAILAPRARAADAAPRLSDLERLMERFPDG